METITAIAQTIAQGVKRDTRVRWGLGAGASVLLSAGVLGMGGSLVPSSLHASSTPAPHVLLTAQASGHLEVVDMSTSTVYEIIQTLPKAERFDLMLYNSGADHILMRKGTYTVFVPQSASFDYLPKGYIADLSRVDMGTLAAAHIVAQALPLEESLNGQVLTAGNTVADFKVDAAADTVTVSGAGVIKVYKASNGYVYLINKVLVPGN